MDIQEKQLLEETAKLARENHKLLKKLYRASVTGRVIRVLYWTIVIGAGVGAFYFLQPYIDQVRELYSGAQGVLDGLGGLGI